jgi:hypothetical protein
VAAQQQQQLRSSLHLQPVDEHLADRTFLTSVPGQQQADEEWAGQPDAPSPLTSAPGSLSASLRLDLAGLAGEQASSSTSGSGGVGGDGGDMRQSLLSPVMEASHRSRTTAGGRSGAPTPRLQLLLPKHRPRLLSALPSAAGGSQVRSSF